ncbi:MAG: hypothetical protein ACI8WB_004178, partial [Phenylobacterium sp.]
DYMNALATQSISLKCDLDFPNKERTIQDLNGNGYKSGDGSLFKYRGICKYNE